MCLDQRTKLRNDPYKYFSSPAHSRVGGPRAHPLARQRVPLTRAVPFLPLAQAQATTLVVPDEPNPTIFTPYSHPAPRNPTLPPTHSAHHVCRLFAKAEERAAGNSDRTGRSRQESGWCVSPYSLFFFPVGSPHPKRHLLPWTGIQLLQAEDLKTWYFSIEVLGESLYKVRLTFFFPTPHCRLRLSRPHASCPCTSSPPHPFPTLRV